jgi:hypothetical protein
MCGRVIQAKGPINYALVDGLNVRDSRLDNYPRRWNAAPSHELLVIRQNPKTGERSRRAGSPAALRVCIHRARYTSNFRPPHQD